MTHAQPRSVTEWWLLDLDACFPVQRSASYRGPTCVSSRLPVCYCSEPYKSEFLRPSAPVITFQGNPILPASAMRRASRCPAFRTNRQLLSSSTSTEATADVDASDQPVPAARSISSRIPHPPHRRRGDRQAGRARGGSPARGAARRGRPDRRWRPPMAHGMDEDPYDADNLEEEPAIESEVKA